MVSLLVTSPSSSALLYPSSIIVAATALLPPREISLSSVSPFVAVVVVLSGSGPSSHDDRCYVVDIDHPRRNLSAASAVIAPSPERKEPVNQNASLIPSPLHSLCLSLCLVHAYAACLVAKMTPPPPRRKRYNLIIICLAGKARKQATHAERRRRRRRRHFASVRDWIYDRDKGRNGSK